MAFTLKLQTISTPLTERHLDYLVALARREGELELIQCTQAQRDVMMDFPNFGIDGKALSVSVSGNDITADMDEASTYRGVTVTVV